MRKIAVIAILACITLGTAHADWTSWASGAGTPNPYQGALDWSGAQISLPKWNPASYPGYYLAQAQVWLRGDLYGDNLWELTTGTDRDITMYQDATITLYYPDGITTLATVLPTDTDQWFNQTAYASGTQTLNGADWTDFVTEGFFSGAALADFTGAGNVALNLTSDSFNYGIAPGGGGATLLTTMNPYGRGRAAIRYEYLSGEIPEPGTLALVGFGLIGLIGVARRRRQK